MYNMSVVKYISLLSLGKREVLQLVLLGVAATFKKLLKYLLTRCLHSLSLPGKEQRKGQGKDSWRDKEVQNPKESFA